RFPRGWVTRMKASIRSLGPKVGASRMVRDYLTEMYEPTARQSDLLAADSYVRAKSLAQWKKHVLAAWPEVKVVDVDADVAGAAVDLGGERRVTVEVTLGSLTTEDVAVELLHGPVAPGDEIAEAQVVKLQLQDPKDGAQSGLVRYGGSFRCDKAGRHGYTVRIVPDHPDLSAPLELGCVAWA
ncbi:MAG TPA: hypothetical protein VFJ79_05075, partial [Acidimicrobiales bacterium]|nr:hypothetical protein [Acidimicrobiales bacterium]